MFKKFLLTSFLLLSSLITIYPSKKENTNFLDYCYSLEKIISRNTVEKNKNLSRSFRPLAKDIALFGTKKTKGTLANKVIDQYKNSKKVFIQFGAFSRKDYAENSKSEIEKKIKEKFKEVNLNIDFLKDKKLYKLVYLANSESAAKSICDFSKKIKINCLIRK